MTGGRKFDGIQASRIRAISMWRSRCDGNGLGIYKGGHVGDVNSHISGMATIILKMLYHLKFFEYVTFNARCDIGAI